MSKQDDEDTTISDGPPDSSGVSSRPSAGADLLPPSLSFDTKIVHKSPSSRHARLIPSKPTPRADDNRPHAREADLPPPPSSPRMLLALPPQLDFGLSDDAPESGESIHDSADVHDEKARPPRPSLYPGQNQSAPGSARDRVLRASIAPAPVALRHSLAPTLPGVAVNATESTRGSVEMVTGLAGALRRIELAEVFRQLNAVGLQSLGFVCLVLGFVGAILVYQAGLQALRIVPDTSNVGSAYLELLVRDLAASITGLMLATRVGAGIAAEIGSMKVTDQLDALRLCRTDPIDYLIAPRVVASVIATPLLTLFGGAIAVLTGAGIGYLAFGINPNVFLDLRYVDIGDLLIGITKSFAFGLSIPLVSAHAGLYTKGGSEGVGNATTNAVVGASLAVIVLGFFIGALGTLVFE